ncbi:MAG: glycosyltransferase family 2 protein [Nitriliruptoraceae bacterium]
MPAELPPLPADPVVSVVVPARAAADTLPATVGSILAQHPPPDEIVIAVGPADLTDPTESVADRLHDADPQRIRVVANPSGRTPDALNRGIAATTGQVIARVDAHSVLPPGYLAAAVATLRRSGAANVGAVQRPVAEHGFGRAVALAMRSPVGTGGAAYRSGQQAGPVDTAYLGVFRREALEAVGGYDPSFDRNQDAELNLRLRAAGYEVWLDPQLVVEYRPRARVGALARQYGQYGRWRRRTVRTHPGSLRIRQLVPPVAVVALGAGAVWSLLRRDARPAGVLSGGYAGVVVGAAAAAAERPREVPATALALATMHLSWGLGFLAGPPRRPR